MDRENADFGRIVGSLTETFGRHCVPVHVCIGSESDFSGVVSLLDPDADEPEALQQEIEDARERLVEAVAETDDDLTMKYLEGEPLSHEELTEGLRRGIAAGSIVPVFAGASAAGIGVKEMLDAIVDFLPSPADVPAPSGANGDSEERPLTADSDGPLAALVFKTTADPFVGRLSYFRVYSGTVKSGNQVWNSGAHRAERIAQPLDIRGESQEPKAGGGSGRHRRRRQAQLRTDGPYPHDERVPGHPAGHRVPPPTPTRGPYTPRRRLTSTR